MADAPQLGGAGAAWHIRLLVAGGQGNEDGNGGGVDRRDAVCRARCGDV